MTTIKVAARVGTQFGSGFNNYFKIVQQLRSLPSNESIEIDLSGCSFLNPFLLLPLALLIREEKKNRQVKIVGAANAKLAAYLDLISFADGGFAPESVSEADLGTFFTKYHQKTYIPIVSFPADEGQSSRIIRQRSLSMLSELLVHQLSLKHPYYTAVMYLLDEAINNLVEHSKESRGFIFAQYYPSRTYIDICIADSGIGILQTYKDRGMDDVITDKDAIATAGMGKSSKNRPEAEGRGYGITSSKAMIAEGLDGKYLLISGNAFLYKSADTEEIAETPPILKSLGTIVGLRVPYAGDRQFNPTDYYEI